MNAPANKKSKSPPESVAATFRAFDRGLHRFLMRRLHSRESTEDIAQEVYLRLLRFGDAELVREPQAYLYRIARNVLYDKLLLQDHERVTFDSTVAEHWSEHPQYEDEGGAQHSQNTGGPVTPQEAVEDVSRQVDSARELEHVLSQLPPMYRAVLVLRKGEGLSYIEIAQELGISVHTVKKYIRLALAQCRLICLQMK